MASAVAGLVIVRLGGPLLSECWSVARASSGLPNFRSRPRTTARLAASVEAKEDTLLQRWLLLPDGRFRGTLPTGLTVEFEGQLVGPSDPGIVLGPGGVRYVLGEAALPEAKAAFSSEDKETGQSPLQLVVAAVSAAVAAILATAVLPSVLQVASPVAELAGPVTKTNVTIVETRRTLPDGSQEKVIDRTTRREKLIPGKPPSVQTTRSERVIRDERALSSAAS